MAKLPKVLLDELLINQDVSTAYDKASEQIYKSVSESVATGTSLPNALSRAGVSRAPAAANTIRQLGGWKLATFRIVVTGGDLENIPDPACVKARLRKYKNPTREQIAAAFDACLKKKD